MSGETAIVTRIDRQDGEIDELLEQISELGDSHQRLARLTRKAHQQGSDIIGRIKAVDRRIDKLEAEASLAAVWRSKMEYMMSESMAGQKGLAEQLRAQNALLVKLVERSL